MVRWGFPSPNQGYFQFSYGKGKCRFCSRCWRAGGLFFCKRFGDYMTFQDVNRYKKCYVPSNWARQRFSMRRRGDWGD